MKVQFRECKSTADFPCWRFAFERQSGTGYCEIDDWCVGQFGPMSAFDQGDAGDGYPTHWCAVSRFYLFMHAEHAIAFKLRWG